MFKLLLLGIIQGLTEFLPISSSGHLVIAQHLLKIQDGVVLLDILLHIGTVLAILTFFRRDIRLTFKNPKWLGYISVTTLITGIIGFGFKNIFESFFHSAHISIFFLINGLILLSTSLSKDRFRELGLLDSILMGLAQGLAIAPGISRSGLTISVLLARGVKTQDAFTFSFIACIPAVLGAFLWKLQEAPDVRFFLDFPTLASILTSYIFGLTAIFLLKKFVCNKKFYFFGFYSVLLAVVIFAFGQNLGLR